MEAEKAKEVVNHIYMMIKAERLAGRVINIGEIERLIKENDIELDELAIMVKKEEQDSRFLDVIDMVGKNRNMKTQVELDIFLKELREKYEIIKR